MTNKKQEFDTFPKLIRRNAKIRPDLPAYREKEYGIWQTYSWKDVYTNSRSLGLGLVDLGLQRGDAVAILGSNRPQLYWVFAAAQSVGALPVPLYQDGVADEIQFVLEHCEAKVVVCEDQEQVDKVLSIMDQCPNIRYVIYGDPRGMRHYNQPFVKSYKEVQGLGEAYDKKNPDFFDAEADKAKGEDIATLMYTSGTTGRPKGVMLSFNNMVDAGRLSVEFENLTENEKVLSYLPMAWVGDHLFSYSQASQAGFSVNCPENAETVLTDLREIGPTYYFAPPAIFENLLTQMMIRIEDASAFKQKMFHYFVDVAKKCGVEIMEGKPVSLMDRLKYAIGNVLIYGPLKNTLGFSQIRVAYTAGAPMGPEVFKFYRSLGINLKQLYGQTESCAYVCIQNDKDVRPDTVGPPAPGCEIKIDEATGEVLFKSPGTFVGYYKNEEATKETISPEGWVHTGDAGIMTDDGQLKVIDRAKDVGKLKDGTLFAPQYIENKLKFFPFISEAVCHGHEKDTVTAFVNIDLEAVGNWAERRGISYTSYQDLASREEVYAQIKECVEQVNKDLAIDSELAGAQISRFLVLPKALDADDGELTRTRKVRRRIIAERYEALINALFSDVKTVDIESQMTFEDGRQGTLKATVKVMDSETYPAMRAAS
ncbi:AMP-binding protein [Sneathiella sp. P13V-1]|uniref:AMP-binding protein n=1 Tax=Sneathiella sp. P13V-1 TaxID=2697366 RepID=UPI00187B5D76|nr:AMP-binding protein [Sneathiella sp. P13V-1]MBE7636278.1 AMP-binding protein [Sneathiella sp. P13V-1]